MAEPLSRSALRGLRGLREAATTNADEDTKQWLDLAIGLDYTARLLIQFALRSAAHRAASEVEPWVELARKAGAEEDAEELVVKFVLEHDEAAELNEDKQAATVKDKLSRLESFAGLVAILISDLRTQLCSDDAEEE